MNNLDKYLPIFLAISVLSNYVSFLPPLGELIYILCLLVLIYSFTKGTIRPNPMPSVFICISVLSILANDIPSFVRPWMRLVVFIFVACLVSIFIENDYLNRLRICLFFAMKWIFLIITIISGLGKILGLSLINKSGFVGYTGHANLFGYIAAQGLIFALILFFYYFNIIKTSKKYSGIVYGMMFLSFLMLLLSACRTALLAFLASSFVFLYLACRNNHAKIIKIYMTMLFVLVLSYPLWKSYTATIINIGKKHSICFYKTRL